MGYEEHSKEFRTGASNSKATLFIKLFGKTFSRKSFCFAALYKKREPFFQVLSVMKELEQKQAHNLHSSEVNHVHTTLHLHKTNPPLPGRWPRRLQPQLRTQRR